MFRAMLLALIIVLLLYAGNAGIFSTSASVVIGIIALLVLLR